jgi:hypothetical protein
MAHSSLRFMAQITDASSGEFQPPPGASKVQLESWRRIFSLRCQQIQTLSPANLACYVKVITSDLKTSRLKQVGDGDATEQRRIDLANGYYSSFLINHCPPQSVVDSTDVARHVMALFYRAVDERLSPNERIHGLDAVKRAFLSLEKSLKYQSLSVGAHDSLQANNNARLNDASEIRTNSEYFTEPPPADSVSHKMGERQNGKSADPTCNFNKEITEQDNEGNAHTSKRSRDEEVVQKSGAIEMRGKAKKTKPRTEDGASVFDSKNTAVIRSVGLEEGGENERLGKGTSEKSASSQTSLTAQNDFIAINKQMTVMEDVSDSPTLFSSASSPPPISICSMRSISFLPDNNSPLLASGCLEPRQSCVLLYDSGYHLNGTGASLDDKSFISVRDRLEQWDPYWKVLNELGRQEMYSAPDGTKTQVATRTTSCTSAVRMHTQNLPASCALVNVDLPSDNNHSKLSDAWGLRWDGSDKTCETGDRRVLLRMLPLTRTEYDKKHHSDSHQWPIGTFIQLSLGTSQQVLLATQRRQQSHDPTLWKGLCHPLDITSILNITDTPFSLKICCRETIEKGRMPKHKIGTLVSKIFDDVDGEPRPFVGSVVSHDQKYNLYKIVYEDGDVEELTYEETSKITVEKNNDQHGEFLKGSYAVHLAVCEYIAPDDLYDELMKTMPKISLETSRELAKKYLQGQIVSIDSDNEGVDSSRSSSLTVSLLCPMSMSAIKTAIRGRQCRHLQCFDMRTFLHFNKNISGGRWRCGVCEDFISVRDLVQCGLYQTMLHEFQDKISAGHDKVSFRSDGYWCLKEDSKSRRGGDAERGKNLNDTCRRRVAPLEVIDLM